jgi:protein ImuB
MSGAGRRIAAIFLPDLACELVSQKTTWPSQDRASSSVPMAVVDVNGGDDTVERADVILAANEAARRYGVRAGQNVAEARALVAHLSVRGLSSDQLHRGLARVADVALGFGPTASIDSGDDAIPPDTVWVDLTGTCPLWGTERAVVDALTARIRELGHQARIAIAGGPRLARAAAVYAAEGDTIVPPSGGQTMMRTLPLEALPLARDRVVWLHRLGLWTVDDVVALPFASLSSRLGERWKETIALAGGDDSAPLVAYEPARTLREETEWDEPLDSIEPLLFALRGLVSLVSNRLEGRGEAAQVLELFVPYDRSIARARGIEDQGLALRTELPTALCHAADLFRVFKTKLEHAELGAPVIGLSITASQLTRASQVQLSLDGDRTTRADPRSMAIFLAEVSAEIGVENVGILELRPVHRPEARTSLKKLDNLSSRVSESPTPPSVPGGATWSCDQEFPTRLLPEPVPITVFAGQKPMISLLNQLFAVEGKSHSVRFDAVEWWTASPTCRDYARVLLTSGKKSVRAWVFTDRTTGRTFLHGYFD